MLIDGEKYACEACVRGHRVSNCNHYERPLQHINKKGRPVSQCPHCRGLRKARSSHVKCECGDKVRKSGSVSPTKHGCVCGQGQRCICAHRKEHLMPYDEIKKVDGLHRSRSHTGGDKPRLSPAMYPDPSMTVFQNGHHKPVHHRNQAGHERGLPYKIPRPHSIHGHSSMARASSDSLPLLSDYSYPYEFIVSQEDMVHSAHNSPALKPKVDLLNQLPQLDLSYGALNTDISSVTSSPQPEEYPHQQQQPAYRSAYFSGVESAPMSAMSGGAPVDLSALGLQAFGNEYTQSTSYGGYDQRLGTPEISDTEDYAGANSPAFYADSPYLGPQDAAAVMGTYNVNVSSDPMSQGLTPPSSMPTSGGLTAGATSMGSLMGAGGVGSPIPSIPRLSPDLDETNYHYSLEASKMNAHPAISRESSVMPSSPPQPFRPTSDPTWSHFPDEQSFLPSNDGVYQAQPTWSH